MTKVGIIAPSFFSYDKAIAKKIAELGNEVLHFDDRPSNSNLSKILIRLKLHFFLNKKILNHRKVITNAIINSNVDTLLVISPEIFNTEMLRELRRNLGNIKIILYLWDSINNKTNFKELLDVTDVTYSFDRKDCVEYNNLKFLPLFYEDKFVMRSNDTSKVYDICFVGSYHSNRAKLLMLNANKKVMMYLHLYVQGPIIKLVRSMPLVFNLKLFLLFWRDTALHTLGKEQVFKLFRKSKTVVDYQHPDQCGLTCRTFEALASGCKLMTTNKDIVNYDFYDENLIYVMKNEGDISLDFIKEDITHESAEKMKSHLKNYSLEEWVRKVLSS